MAQTNQYIRLQNSEPISPRSLARETIDDLWSEKGAGDFNLANPHFRRLFHELWDEYVEKLPKLTVHHALMTNARRNIAYRHANRMKPNKETDPELDESLFEDVTTVVEVANFQYQTELEGRANELASEARLASAFLIGLQSLKKRVEEVERSGKAIATQQWDGKLGRWVKDGVPVASLDSNP